MMSDRTRRMIELYGAGLSLRVVAGHMRNTPQAVHKAIKRWAPHLLRARGTGRTRVVPLKRTSRAS